MRQRRHPRFGEIEFAEQIQPPILLIRNPLDNSVNRKYKPRTLSPSEGRFAIVTTRWARDAMDAVASGRLCLPDENAATYGEVVWSWRRDPGATLAGSIPPATGARKAAPRGEHV